MKPAPFAYCRPGSLTDAVAALAGDPGAKVLAGGQSLVPLLSMRLAAPSMLVDINGLPGLDTITADESGVTVGALARHADVLASADVRRVQPLVTMALSHVAHATIRNRGTTVGSLVHADAAAEMPVVLTLLGGSLEVEGPGGRRTIPAGELYVGPLESSVHHDEIAVSAFFPALAAGAGVAFDEIARRHGDYALVGAAALVDGDSVRVGYLSVADVPTVVDLSGVPDDRLGDVALEQLEPDDDIHATADYRAQLVRVLTARVVRSAREGARRMSEERHDVVLTVNGTAHPVRVPARRLLSDALRHDLGLTGTHVGCEHGVCGACTVLVDGRPMRSCLILAVSAQDARDHHRRGAHREGRLARPGAAGVPRVPRAAVRLLHPRLPHHDHRRAARQPRAHPRRGQRHDRRQPVPLHRLPEHRQGGRARGRACPAHGAPHVHPPEPPEPAAGQLEFEDRDDDNASTGLGA